MIKRFVFGILAALVVLLIGGFWLAFFSTRPPLMLDPAVLEGDGSVIDYCARPTLHGQGKTAAEFPKGNTPGCGYDHFPLPILAGCTEPLPEAADDLRGLWVGVDGQVGHVERVEQCGSLRMPKRKRCAPFICGNVDVVRSALLFPCRTESR